MPQDERNFRKKNGDGYLEHLRYLEKMDQINRSMQGTNDLEQVMKDVLDTLLSVFECDRAWLVYPCDPDSPTWQVPMERTRPEYPGVLPIGVELPLDPVGAEVYRILRNTDGPVKFGAGETHPVPMEMAAAFHVQSFIAMAFYPKIGEPWSFGLHQCSHARVWNIEEESLFQEVGRRLSDTLTGLLTYRNLLESEKQIKQLIDASPVAMVVSAGSDEHVEWVNDKFVELFGYTIEDMPDVEHWWSLAYPDENYREEIKVRWNEKMKKVMQEGSHTAPMEAAVRCKDGSLRHVEFRLSSIGQKHLITFVDLTERKQMEDALLERERHSQSLLRLSRKLEQAQTYPDVLNAAYEEVREIIGYQNLWVYRVTEDKKHAHSVFAGGAFKNIIMSEDGTATLTIQGDRMMEEIVEARDIVVVEDARTDPRTNKELVEALGNRTIVNVPIILSDRHLGSVGTGTFGNEGVRVPTALEREYLTALASHMAVTLDRVHLIEQRRLSDQALRENEEKFRTLAENSPDNIARYDTNCRTIYVNPTLEKTLRRTAPEMLGTFPGEAGFIAEAEEYQNKLRKVLQTGEEAELDVVMPDTGGGKRYHNIRFVAEHGVDNTITGVLAIGRDITERKLAEAQLIASEQLFRALVENSPDYIARYDREFRRIYVNPAIQKLFGVPVQNVLGTTPSEQSPVYAPQVYVDHIRRVFDTAAEGSVEMPFRTAKGEMHWGHMRFVPEIGADGMVKSVLAIGRDIHEIKENERRFRRLAENFPDLVMRFDYEGRYIYVNPAFEKAFGVPAEEVIGKKPQELLKNNMILLNDPLLIEYVLEEGEPKESAAHWNTETGERIFENRYIPEKDATGNVVSVLCIARDITERKRAEEALSASEAELRTLINTMTDVIFVGNSEGRYLKIIDTNASMLYKPPQELLGRTLHEVFPKEKADFFLRHLRQALETKQSVDFEYDLMIGDQLMWFYATISPMTDDQMLMVARDITDRKQAEEALRESERRLIAAQHMAHVGYWERDFEANRVLLSNEACRIFGISEHGLSLNLDQWHPRWVTLIHPEDQPRLIKLLGDVLEGVRSYDTEYRIIQPDGAVRYIHSQAEVRRDASGKPLNMLGMMQDITERKRAEEEVRKLNQELEQRVLERTAQLAEVNNELEAFAYSVSHDLRAPLRHIDGFIELLQKRIQTTLDEKSLHYMNMIADSSKQMGTLIDDLLSFSRMNRTEMFKSQVDLNELVQDVIQEFLPETEGRIIEWQVGSLPHVTCDRAMLRAALVNLVSNALKFTNMRETARIEIGCEKEDGTEAILYVRDNGVGFDMQYVDKLFGVFQRLHRADEFEGTGIGLANVRRIINRHGGRIWAEGEVGRGASFYFSLPTPK